MSQALPWKRRLALISLAAIASAGLQPAVAAEFPQRAIKIIVGFAPGGSTDTITRELARRLEASLGQAIVVENKPGAGQMVSMLTAASASPDGYTLVIGSPGGFSVSPNVYKDIKYDARKFVPISPIAAQPVVLVARPDFPANNFTELVKLAKSQGSLLNYASFGAGTGSHLGMEMLKKRAGFDATHIPYRGDPLAIMALKSKEVDVAVLTMFSALPRIKSGEFKGLGIYQARPDRNLPQLQTTAQAGFADIDLPSWLGLFAPPKTPGAASAKLEAATRAVIASPEFQEFVISRGNEPLTMPNKDFMAMIEKQTVRLGSIIRAIKLQPD